MEKKTQNLLVTGATSALASSLISLAAKNNNYRVLAISRSNNPIEMTEGLIEFNSVTGIDLSNERGLDSLKTNVKEFFDGKFDAIHFAGDFWRHKPLISTNFSEIISMINSHYITLCGVAKAITPIMMKNREGRLVAFSCNSVGYSYPDMSPFTAAKAAVESFMKCYSNEYAPHGISATAIALPTMKTDEILTEKPDGDHKNYIAPDELSCFILEHVLTQPAIVTGNVIRLINPSPTFYGMGYFERNPRKVEHNNAMHPTATVASAPFASGDG